MLQFATMDRHGLRPRDDDGGLAMTRWWRDDGGGLAMTRWWRDDDVGLAMTRWWRDDDGGGMTKLAGLS